ncbi:MAG: DUF433 domain-containing protein [Planctomycetota bacterium]
MDNLLDRIVSNPDVLGGKPIIRGTRLTVERVLSLLEAGVGEKEILADFPMLTSEDIRACIAYARHVVAEEDVFPVATASRDEEA